MTNIECPNCEGTIYKHHCKTCEIKMSKEECQDNNGECDLCRMDVK